MYDHHKNPQKYMTKQLIDLAKHTYNYSYIHVHPVCIHVHVYIHVHV